MAPVVKKVPEPCGRVSASQLGDWVFDPRTLSESL